MPTVLGREGRALRLGAFAGAGSAALVAASEVVYLVLRVVGAGELLRLGVGAWRAAWRTWRGRAVAGEGPPAALRRR